MNATTRTGEPTNAHTHARFYTYESQHIIENPPSARHYFACSTHLRARATAYPSMKPAPSASNVLTSKKSARLGKVSFWHGLRGEKTSMMIYTATMYCEWKIGCACMSPEISDSQKNLAQTF